MSAGIQSEGSGDCSDSPNTLYKFPPDESQSLTSEGKLDPQTPGPEVGGPKKTPSRGLEITAWVLFRDHQAPSSGESIRQLYLVDAGEQNKIDFS